MIQNRKDYLDYLQADLEKSSASRWGLKEWLTHDILRWQRLLRKLEYYINCKHDFLSRCCRLWLEYRFYRLSRSLGFSIRPNNFGPGLTIPHAGTIVVNALVRVGGNCKLHTCVNIGHSKGGAPSIGNDVYIGPGVKMFGDITIGDNVIIGANAVVNKDIRANVTIAGVPAKIIS